MKLLLYSFLLATLISSLSFGQVTLTQAVATAASTASSPEFTEFLRVSRRMISAIGTGVSYRDFAERLIELAVALERLNHRVRERDQGMRVIFVDR